MRHRKSGRKFGRNSAHRKAMFRNMVTSLLEHGGIRTTVAKAKELRRFVEPTITQSLRVQDIVAKAEGERTPEEKARLVHAMRMAGRYVHDRAVLRRLFYDLGPALKGRPGGYTRIVKLGRRVGDGAPMARIELVDLPPASEG
ncbi:MAG: 50S ribosomal protein L17 [Deltaproteobacteria bacterium]|nr:MAG: 50S ribosomal protein L17 [Deltaproteobacteria bacterium]